MTNLSKCAVAPCKSCPYRRDVPSGVWDASEYDKLPLYDGEIIDQAMNGGTPLFQCHQRTGELCAGWVGCHGVDNLLALRLHADKVDPSVFDYESPVPLFSSGQEACDHGKRDIDNPDQRARRTANRLIRKGVAAMDGTEVKKCKHGHEMTEANTIRMKAGGVPNGKTQCRACKVIQSAASREKRRNERDVAERIVAQQRHQQAAE